MEKLRVDLFGRFDFASESGNLIEIEGGKTLELYRQYLILQGYLQQSRMAIALEIINKSYGNKHS